MTNPTEKEVITVRHEQEEWIVSVSGDRVQITQCAGAFGLPTSQVSIFGGCAESVAKAIAAAGKRTKPDKWVDGGYLDNGRCPFMRVTTGACCCLGYGHEGDHQTHRQRQRGRLS